MNSQRSNVYLLDWNNAGKNIYTTESENAINQALSNTTIPEMTKISPKRWTLKMSGQARVVFLGGKINFKGFSMYSLAKKNLRGKCNNCLEYNKYADGLNIIERNNYSTVSWIK